MFERFSTYSSSIEGAPRCFLYALLDFISNAVGLQSNGTPHLLPTYDDSNLWPPSGSYALFSCVSGYVNTGGSLNVTCNPNGRWSPFPKCVPRIAESTCPYSPSMLTLSNGYSSNVKGLQLSTENQAESRSFIDYLCTPPYTLASNSRMTCVNGTWSAQPLCASKLKKPIELQILRILSLQVRTTTAPSLLPCGDIPSIPNAYVANALWINFGDNIYPKQVQFKCNSGYRHVSTAGALWVSCMNGIWSTFPVCTGMVLSI